MHQSSLLACQHLKRFGNRTYRANALQIVVNGKELPRTTELWYFAANKPKGYLCANAPGKDGTTKLVIDLFEVTPDCAACCHGVHASQGNVKSPCNVFGLLIRVMCCNRTGEKLSGRGNIRIQGLSRRGSSLLDALMWPLLASYLSPMMVCPSYCLQHCSPPNMCCLEKADSRFDPVLAASHGCG